MKYVLWIGLISAMLMALLGDNPLWPILLFFGVLANGLVIAANGWKMPVRGRSVEGPRHAPMTPSTRLRFLGDVIPLGFGIASVGDFLIWAGVLGVYTHRAHNYAEIVGLSAFGLWTVGWSRGFNLFRKWDREELRDSRKNIPIVLVLMLVGNLLSIRGCSAGELNASAKEVKQALTDSPTVQAAKPKSAQKYHDLGKLAAPDIMFLRRLRQETAKSSAKEARELAVKVTATFNSSFSYLTPSARSARKGPFCRVTCTGCHGGKWDVETAPELCRANWIPPDTHGVPGWYAISDKEEIARPWPGPAEAGFEAYKLYWSDVQSEAKEISPSKQP